MAIVDEDDEEDPFGGEMHVGDQVNLLMDDKHVDAAISSAGGTWREQPPLFTEEIDQFPEYLYDRVFFPDKVNEQEYEVNKHQYEEMTIVQPDPSDMAVASATFAKHNYHESGIHKRIRDTIKKVYHLKGYLNG